MTNDEARASFQERIVKRRPDPSVFPMPLPAPRLASAAFMEYPVKRRCRERRMVKLDLDLRRESSTEGLTPLS
jgi:hypothetical protein